MKEAGITVNEINSGCICCSLVGDFDAALKDVVAQYSPDLIIIEPSGVGKLSDVIKSVQDVAESVQLELCASVAVVDAKKAKMYMKSFGEFYENQIENATTIVLSRTQLITEDKLNTAIELIKEHNDKAAIITTPWDEIDGKVIVEAMEHKDDMLNELLAAQSHAHHEHEHHHEHGEDCTCGCHDHDHEHHHDHDEDCTCGCHDHDHEHHHEHGEDCTCGCHDHEHHHHHADDVFTSWGMETPKKYSEDDIKAILEKLSEEDNEIGMVLRAKGIVPATDGEWIHFDMVPEEFQIRRGPADYTGRICVIGTKLDENALKELF